MIVDYKSLSNYLKNQEGGALINVNRHHKNNLEERVSIYKSVDKILSKLSYYECLEAYANDKYKIRDIIKLDKKIGSKSKYGVIFLSTIVNKSHEIYMVSKVMKNDRSNDNEIILMKIITIDVLIKKKSKHFVFLYKYFICEKKNVPPNKRLLSINELATGDIKTLFQNKLILNNDELLMNMFFQGFLSIATFQNLINHVHKDTHYGNFLYQENYEKGYYHYVFKKKSYYLKACEYNVMLYDFGFAINIDFLNKMSKSNSKYIAMDYLRICNAYLNKKDGWGIYNELPKIQFNNKILIIMSIMLDIRYDNQSDFFEQLLMRVFIPYSPKGMFLTNRPAKVINIKPFNID